jgi:kinesin family protein C1
MVFFFFFLFYAWQGKLEQMTEQIKRLKLCIKWFQQVDENHVLEKQKLQSAIESVEKKCKDNGKV